MSINIDYDRILGLISNVSSKVNTLCIGDVMLDKFVYGLVERISPEAPVPVFSLKTEKIMLGGAGNVAINLSTLGCNVSFFGVAGRDENAKVLSRLFRDSGVKHYFVKIPDYPTIVKTRILANNQHLLRIDKEEKFKIPYTIIGRLSSILKKIISKQDIVLLSDYNKGVFSVESCQMVIDLANELGKKTIVDPKGTDYSKYRNAYLVKPNLKEFKDATGLTSVDPKSENFLNEIKLGAEVLYQKFNIQNLIVTLSEHGMVYVSPKSEKIFHIPTVAKEVFDVSGAGDTSLATLGMSLANNFSISDAMVLANIASGIVVGKLGTSSVTLDEICLHIKMNKNQFS